MYFSKFQNKSLYTAYIILQHTLHHWLIVWGGRCVSEWEWGISCPLTFYWPTVRKLMKHHLCFRPIGSLSDESKVNARLLPWLRLAGWIVKWMMNELRDEPLCSIIFHHIHTLHIHTHCTVTQRPLSVLDHQKYYRKHLTDHRTALLTLNENKQKRFFILIFWDTAFLIPMSCQL